MPDHLIVHHPKLKAEGLMYVFQSDWDRLKTLVRNIRDPSFLWGNLAFTVLGFALSCLASVIIYHVTADPAKTSHALLGFGYTTGLLSILIAILLYGMHKKSLPGASSSRTDIEQVIGIIEAKLIQSRDERDEEEEIERREVPQPATHVPLSEMKRIAFRSLSKEN